VKDEHAAIGADEAGALFAPLRRYELLVLAVSGGSDSIALLKLAHQWCLGLGAAAPHLSVATVDHQLRKDSAGDAAFVTAFAAELERDCTTLVWDGQKPWSGVLDAAREARYRLLEQHAHALAGQRTAAVVTAHTLDDQAETVMMRLKRGTGVDGLAAMSVCRPISEGSPIDLVRPLLGVRKTRLEGTLIARGLPWREDSSNEDQFFERVRVRKAVQNLKYMGVTTEALARTADRARQAREAIDYAAEKLRTSLNIAFNGEIFASFERAAFDQAPSLLRQRVLAPLITRFGGATPAAELRELERLCEAMTALPRSTHTLGGVTISSGERYVRLWREVGRIARKPLRLEPGRPVLWDGRFLVAHTLSRDEAVTVSALGEGGYRAIAAADLAVPACPARAAYALPAFRSGGDLLAVPQLGVEVSGGALMKAGSATRCTSVPAAQP
jgi:tRNA(Ile)-lysidine synthase